MDERWSAQKLQEAVGGGVIDRIRTEQIVGAVFSALSTRLTITEVERFLSQLSPSLKKLWFWRAVPKSILSEIWKEEGVTELSRTQFLTLIQMEGDLASTEEAEAAAQCVLYLLSGAMKPGDIQDTPGRHRNDEHGYGLLHFCPSSKSEARLLSSIVERYSSKMFSADLRVHGERLTYVETRDE